MTRLGRRALIFGAATAACTRGLPNQEIRIDDESSSAPTSSVVRVFAWDFGQEAWGPARAVVLAPAWGASEARYPVLVALHGRGEALKAPARGAFAWPRDYALVRAFERLRAPPLRAADYENLVLPEHLAAVNASLIAAPFDGLVVACPWLPDVHPAATADIRALEQFVVHSLLPRVRSETPALAHAEATGIDGVSLGGVLGMRIGLRHPESFGCVGGIQPALSEGQERDWIALALSARARRPGLKLRLATSWDDTFRDPVLALSRAWDGAGVQHDLADGPGPHDYVYNRGPGALELLMWHDRALQRA